MSSSPRSEMPSDYIRLQLEGKKCPFCTPNKLILTSILLFALSITLIALALFLPPLIQNKLDDGISEFVYFTAKDQQEDNDNYRVWADGAYKDAPPRYYNTYFFNITNPVEVLNGSDPIMAEIGPFRFQQIKTRFNVTFASDEAGRNEVTYFESSHYELLQDQTAPLTLDDRIFNLNLGFQIALSVALNVPANFGRPAVYKAIAGCAKNLGLSEFDLFIRSSTIKELLYGFQDPLLVCVKQAMKPPIQDAVPIGFPGLLSEGGVEGPTSLIVDKNFNDLTHQYTQYNGQRFLRVEISLSMQGLWGTDAANIITGTTAEQFKRGIKPGQVVQSYISELMRVADLINSNEETVTFRGITLYRFTLKETDLLNVNLYPPNSAYYQTTTGLIDVSRTQQLLPVFVTKPHFLDCDTVVSQFIHGLTDPNEDRNMYDTYVDVEPNTGATMWAAKRLQINIHPAIMNEPDLKAFAKLNPKLYIPLQWIEQTGSIPADSASTFKDSVYFAINAKHYILIIGFTLGIIFIVLGIFLFLVALHRARVIASANTSIDHTNLLGSSNSVHRYSE